MNQLDFHQLRFRSPLFLAAIWVAACGGDDVATNVKGIYKVSSHTQNEAGCDKEGGPARFSVPFFYVKKQEFAFGTYFSATGCGSLEACRVAAKADFDSSTFLFTFHTAKNANELVGEERTSGFTSDEKICTEPSVSDLSFVRSGDAVRIEERKRIGDDHPPDKEGYCTTELGEKASKGKPCSQYVVVTATYVEPLPK